MERGEHTGIPESKGFQIISRLGYEASLNGLEKFCLDSAELLRNYNIRSEKFQKALFAHIYPDGTLQKGGKIGAGGVTQEDIINATNSSFYYVRGLLNGTITPKEADIKAILPLFGLSSEQEFYDKADAVYRENTNLIPPKPSASHAETKKFGELVNALREELGISLDGLDTVAFERNQNEPKPDVDLALRLEVNGQEHIVPEEAIYDMMQSMGCESKASLADKLQGKSDRRDSSLSRLERGDKILPLEEDKKAQIINALGCQTAKEFETIASKAETVQRYRTNNFKESLEKLTKSGNNKHTAKLMLEIHRRNPCTPTAVKEIWA